MASGQETLKSATDYRNQSKNPITLVLGLQSSISAKPLIMRNRYTGDTSFSHIEDFFEWLLELRGVKVCWKIDSWVSPILAMLSTETLEALYRTGTASVGEYRIYYNMGKSFNIQHGKRWASVYWIEQYFEGQPEPDTVKELEDKTWELLVELNTIGITPKRLTSAVSMFTEAFDKIPLPTWRDVPDRVNELAWQCSGCAWTEAHKLGHFDTAYDYDLSSSFPSIIAKLLDTRYGKWVESREIPESAVYGVGCGTVRVASDLSPILYHAADSHFYSSKGTMENKPIMLQSLRWLRESESGDYHLDEGHWWIPKKTVLPLQLTMHKMFAERKMSRTLNRVVKRAMNGLYGKQLEIRKNGAFGERFNPIWGGTIETEVGIIVAKFILDNLLPDMLLHISTDGVLALRDVPLVASGKMGTWRLDSQGPALVVSSGVLFYGDKRPNQINYQEAMSMIQAAPDNYEWQKDFERRMTLGDFIEHNLPIGTMARASTSFRLTMQHDRAFRRVPTSGRELLSNVYESTALPVSKLRPYKE